MGLTLLAYEEFLKNALCLGLSSMTNFVRWDTIIKDKENCKNPTVLVNKQFMFLFNSFNKYTIF